MNRLIGNKIIVRLMAVSISISMLFAFGLQALALNQNLQRVAKISFTFDDGLQSAFTQAAPTLAKYGFAATNYVVSSCVGMTTTPNNCKADEDVPYMDWSQIHTLVDTYGWEIGSHSATHPYLASSDPDDQPNKLTTAEVVNELTTSKSVLTSNGITTTAFSSPYGDWNQPVLAEIAKVYTSHRGFADTGYNPYPYSDYLLRDQPVQVGVSVATVKGYIDYAIANNQWLILTMHDIRVTPSTDPDDYQYSTADLDAIASYVKEKNLPVVNISEGLINSDADLFGNETFDSPLVDSAISTATWNTDSPATIKQDTQNNGSGPSPTNSVKMESANVNSHLFSTIVKIDPTQTYVIKCYLNVTAINSGAIGFYIDEYNSEGTWLSGQFKVQEPSVYLENLNFEYAPTSTAVTSARLQLIVSANSGISAYLDTMKFLSPVAISVTTNKTGDANSDGLINALDLSIMLTNWGKSGATLAQGDVNGDLAVGALDLSILLTNWGK